MPDDQPYRLVPHRGQWSLAFRPPGGDRVRIATGTDDRGLAEARARDIWRARTAPPSERVADLWPFYVAERRASGAAFERADATWRALEPVFGHRLGAAISREDCRDYAKRRRAHGRSASTARTELELLRACLKASLGPRAPSLWVPPPSAPRDRWLTREEVTRLLDGIETPHVRLFVILAISTGARMTALLELTWDRVDLDRRFVSLQPAGRHQSNKRRGVKPLNARALAALREAKPAALTDHVIEWAGEPVKSVKRAIAAAARRSGVPCSPHVFRHTAGVWMAEQDVPMQKIAQFLDHTSTKVTERVYARYAPSFMRDAAAALDW